MIKIPEAAAAAVIVVIAILNAMGNNRVPYIFFYYSDYRLHILYYTT